MREPRAVPVPFGTIPHLRPWANPRPFRVDLAPRTTGTPCRRRPIPLRRLDMLIPRAGMVSAIVILAFLAAPVLAEDHSEYIEGPFESGPEVTETCLFCHDDAEEVMETTHWNWGRPRDGEEGEVHGKINAFNNFCIAVSSNWARCTSCHAGYGWKDASFDFDDPNAVDCLVCHDRSGTYRKDPAGAGAP